MAEKPSEQLSDGLRRLLNYGKNEETTMTNNPDPLALADPMKIPDVIEYLEHGGYDQAMQHEAAALLRSLAEKARKSDDEAKAWRHNFKSMQKSWGQAQDEVDELQRQIDECMSCQTIEELRAKCAAFQAVVEAARRCGVGCPSWSGSYLDDLRAVLPAAIEALPEQTTSDKYPALRAALRHLPEQEPG